MPSLVSLVYQITENASICQVVIEVSAFRTYLNLEQSESQGGEELHLKWSGSEKSANLSSHSGDLYLK